MARAVHRPGAGPGMGELMRTTGMTRPASDGHRRGHVRAGRAVSGQPGMMARPDHRRAVTVSDRLTGRLV